MRPGEMGESEGGISDFFRKFPVLERFSFFCGVRVARSGPYQSLGTVRVFRKRVVGSALTALRSTM